MTEAKNKRGRPPGSKNKTQNKEMPRANTSAVSRLKDEIWAIVIMALGAFLVISLQTEAAGQLGHILSGLLKGCFGHIAYVLPYYLILYGLLLFAKRTAHISGRSVFFLFLIFLMLTLLNSSRFLGADTDYSLSLSFIGQMYSAGVDLENGGAFGMTVGYLLIKIIGITGLYIFSTVVILISLMLVINTPVSQFFDNMKAKRQARKQEDKTTVAVITPAAAADPVPVSKPIMAEEKKIIFERKELKEKTAELPVINPVISNTRVITENQLRILDYMKDDGLFEKTGNSSDHMAMGLEEITAVEAGLGLEPDTAAVSHQDIQAAAGFEKTVEKPTKDSSAIEELNIKTDGKNSKLFQLPHIDLLAKAPANSSGESENLKAKAAKLEQTLLDFNVNAKVMQVTKGPAVTRYEIQPSTGVKVSSIVRLSDDIALNLEAKSIRIEAPIPGKAAVGIEVENERVNLVAIREIIESVEYKSSKSKISFAVGKDIAGKSIVADLKSMPHLLIAGSTGSGKSVCINSIIISMLYKAKPDEVKFVLIDPKVVELNNYNGIPHLLIPVVTEPGKAAAALNWAVAEMTERYKKFAEEGVRDLEAFNNSIKKKGETERLMPQIVIIIDELADLMMAAPSQVEESICRLAQMARAAGMHLIVATQRPSVDIITGVIKANIPSRIAFAVSSQFDSRTILDMSGAEKLVGKGDMLFHPMGTAKPFRVQGTFISDSEVHRVIEFVKCQVPDISYSNEVIHSIEKVQTTGNDEDTDELLPDAIETVVRAEQASVSMLQRRFRIGYNRAARLIDMMEARGIIGPADGSRPRKVLMTENEFLALSSGDEES
ncbi:MAG: DNA translocase FtsK 4TM domain-containing protein [Eubacteriales bacterium]|nr:DNA translocase FtsK 4TM domain-containing protein [Eubacteriales bacterium]MDD3199895.1 DNA translocase FtsK 4TM domain-containing protein [Eubacteriales bacterium]MDD4121499.1 DNA translocase FtsK 4TM domain-containing protein [Eubacteriales bacterium]MDD4630514.1 DNA translocase FtsK 4TM domain-containing protein [Eubacteriales bacterium]